MYGLSLRIVFWMLQPVCTRDCLRSFVRFETHVESSMKLRVRFIAQSLVAKHQVVMGLQVLRIDAQGRLKFLDCIRVLVLEEQSATQIVAHDAVARILFEHQVESFCCFIIVAVVAKNASVEIIRSRKIRLEGKRLLQYNAGTLHVAFLHGYAAQVHPAIHIVGIDLGDLLEGGARTLQISLQEESDAIVVPPSPVIAFQIDLRQRRWSALRRHLHGHFVFGNRNDRQIRDLLHGRGDIAHRSR